MGEGEGGAEASVWGAGGVVIINNNRTTVLVSWIVTRGPGLV